MTLKVGAAVVELLGKSTELAALVGNKIFPVAAKEDTPRPFVIYQRTGLNPSYTKDNRKKDSVYMGFSVISETYSASVMIAGAIFKALENKRGTYASLDIDDIKLSDCNEEADEINFIQNLEFEIFINV